MQAGPYMRVDELGRYYHWCPECKMAHPLPSDTGKWSFNGDVENPTFQPSFRQGLGNRGSCHYFIIEGKIHWCSDSWHGLSSVEPMVPLNDSSVDDGEGLEWI